MAKGKQAKNGTLGQQGSGKDGTAKAAARAAAQERVAAAKRADRQRKAAADAAAKAVAHAAAQAARDAEAKAWAAASTSPQDFLKKKPGLYSLPVDGGKVECEVYARTYSNLRFVSEEGKVTNTTGEMMFRLRRYEGGVPVALLGYKTPETFTPLSSLPHHLQEETRQAFEAVYPAVKDFLPKAKSPVSAVADAYDRPATRAEILANMAHKAKADRDAVLGIATEKYGTYDLGGAIFSLVDAGGGKILRFEGLTKAADKKTLQGVISGAFLPLWVLAKVNYQSSDAVPETVQAVQKRIHAYVHSFAAEHGVHAKVKSEGAQRFTGYLRRGHQSTSHASA